MKVTDEDGFLSRCVGHKKANFNHSCRQQHRVLTLHLNTAAPLHDERVITVWSPICTSIFFYEVSQKCGHFGSSSRRVSKSFQELVTVLKKLESEVQPVIGLRFKGRRLLLQSDSARHGP